MVAESGITNRPAGRRTIALDRSATPQTAPRAPPPRHPRASDQQPPLPRHLAARGPAAPDRGLQRRQTGGAAASPAPADLRRVLRSRPDGRARPSLPRPLARLEGLDPGDP